MALFLCLTLGTGVCDVLPNLPTAGHIAAYNQVEYSLEQFPIKGWHLSKIMAPEAWQITAGESDILVAVLDTGIDQKHPDLEGKVVSSINFTSSPTADDLNGHGTHIAGIIAAATDDTDYSRGVAYNCSLMNVKVADDNGWCNSDTVAKGLIWAVDNGAKVVNISLTITKPSPVLEKAVNYAWSKGVVIVAAAGNDYSSSPRYPAAYVNVIAVAATQQDDKLPSWSNRGDWISLSSPGVDIYSTLPDNQYGYQSGTSTATAIVSGEAALLFTVATDDNSNGYLNDEIRQRIEANCDRLTLEELETGRINVLKALTE